MTKIIIFIQLILLTNSFAQQTSNQTSRLEWLQNVGFGMFVHWSMDSQIGSVISHSMVGASEKYLKKFVYDLPQTFNPKRFEAEELVVLAKLAGMKYVTFTTKHHSGFCMWDTKSNDFNIMNTPYKKDIVAEFVAACKKYDMGLGFYFSPEDFWWLYTNGLKITRRGPNSNPDDNPEYMKYLKAQMTELMTNYGPVDVVFFDGAGSDQLKKLVWEIQPTTIVTRGELVTPEQTLPGIPLEGAWEGNLTMGTQWQYKPSNEEYKDGTRLLEILIETRAKGGTQLLNVGPKPNGELPIEQEGLLREIALWHTVNEEAIHNTRPWIVTNEGDIWFTKNKDDNTVYAFLTKIPDWPRGQRKEFVLSSIKATDKTKLDVLGQSSKWVEYQPQADAFCRWEQKENGLLVSVVRAQRLYNNHKWPNPVVLKLTHVLPGLVPPIVETHSAKVENNSVTFFGTLANMGKAEFVNVGFEYRPYAGFVEELYKNAWSETDFFEKTTLSDFSFTTGNLEKGKTYQVRAVVKHPLITIYGDIKRFTMN